MDDGQMMSKALISIWDFCRFVYNRRLDSRFNVLPEKRLTVAILLAGIVTLTVLAIYADPVFLQWVQAGNAQKDGWFAYTTNVGRSTWMLVSSGSILVAMLLFRIDRFSGRKFVTWYRIFLGFYFFFTTIAYSGLLALLMKNAIGRARPRFVEEMQVWQFVPFGDNYDFASFPSGHATTAGAASMALALIFPKTAIFFLLASVWIAISRLVIGVHFPSDIAAGLLFGAMFSWLYARAFAHRRLLFEFSATGRLKPRG